MTTQVQLELDWLDRQPVPPEPWGPQLRPLPQRRPIEVLSLDTWAPGQRPPRARTTDPLSSHAAADRMEASGRMGAQMAAVLVLIERFPGSTSRELAEQGGLDRHAVARRCPDLERRGLVQRAGVPGEQVRWFPVAERRGA